MQSEKCSSSQKGRRDSQSSTSHSKKRPHPRPTIVKKNNKDRQHMITATTGMNDSGPSEKRQSSATTVRENLLIEEINVCEAVENNGSLVFPPQVEGEQLNKLNVNHDGITNDVNLGVRSVDMQAFGASEVNCHAKDGNVSFQASKSFRTKRRKPSSTPRFLKDETDSKLEKLKVARSLVDQPAQQHQKSFVDNLDDNNDASGTSDTFKALREMTVGQRRSNPGGEGGPATNQESNIEGGRKLPVEEEDGERLAERQNGDAENQKPQLPDGFYEVEAIRKKRIKKGQTQYLIKWRGWPESTNTWEPYDHLLACADDVEAFEQRTRSRKHKSSQKGKRTQSRVQAAQQHQKSSGDNPDDNNGASGTSDTFKAMRSKT